MTMKKGWTPGDVVQVRSPLQYGSKLEYTAVVTHSGALSVTLTDGTIWQKESDTIARAVDPLNPNSDWHIELVQP